MVTHMVRQIYNTYLKSSLGIHAQIEQAFSPRPIILDHLIGPDWVYPSVFVCQTEKIGLGLITLEPIKKGDTVILFGGKLMTKYEVKNLPEDMRDIPFQVSDDIYFGIADRSDIGIGERINHSCNPNVGFVSEMRLVALREISAGEDIVMDYATCSSTEDYALSCSCESENCRKVIRGTDWMLLDLQKRLGRYYQPYLKEKLACHKNKK